MRSTLFGFLLILGLVTFAHAGEKQRPTIALIKVEDGAVLDVRDAVEGRPLSELYRLTQLSCTEESHDIRVLLPIDKASSLAQADTSLMRAKGRWSMVFKAHGRDFSKRVEFKPITDKKSRVALAAEITINFGDPLWKALVDKSGTTFLALNGGPGTYVSVTDEAWLSRFLNICHLNK